MLTTKKHDPVRIGFYVCHCGTNIAGMVDVDAVAKYAATLPNVAVSRNYKYMCSDPGQELIQQDILENRLNRIVVAACSPLLHELTFRKATQKGGINPFFFQMVNIREHNSWVHTDRGEATRKAMSLARAAIQRVPSHKPLEVKKAPIYPDVLILGGGIAGIHAALVMANAGKHVYLVEREATIGGHMAKFDKTFPTLDCAACVLSPKMAAVGSHPNITLWTYSDVIKVDGYVGNFKITVKRKPRYILEDLCTGCQECIEACVYKEPKFRDDFNLGLGKRKPVYIPFPQAIPAVTLIDPETCIELKTGKCKKTCVEACGDRKAIDFKQREDLKEIQVGTIIVATGYKTFDPVRTPYYGYGVYPNVYTALEIERLVNASGPESSGGGALRGIARHEHQPLVLARLLPVFVETGAPDSRADPGADLQLLYRHAHTGKKHGGVLQPHRRGRHTDDSRQGGRCISGSERWHHRPADRAGRRHLDGADFEDTG
jgi:heterodisulfide reductase subunit A